MPLIKDKYKGDHARSKYLRKNQVIKNPQVQSQYETTDQKLVAQSKEIQEKSSNVIGTKSVSGYKLPQDNLTNIGTINPGEILDLINLSYYGGGTDPLVTLLWSFLDPTSITSTVSTGLVTITEGNAFFIIAQSISVSKNRGGVILNDLKIANPKKTIYLYAASSESTIDVTVVKNEYTNK